MKTTSTLIIALLNCLILGCTGAKKPDNSDSTKTDSSEKIIQIEESTPSNNKLVGIWTDGESENATFKITQDSIYYVDHFKSYKYKTKNDSIKIFYDDFNYDAKIYFLKDTLVMDFGEDGVSKFWKFND